MWPFRRERKENPVGSVISAYKVGQPIWTERKFESFAKEGFQQNAIVYKCVKLIATSAATVPWMLTDKSGKEIERHPLLDLLNRPSPSIGGHALFEAFYAFMLLAGNTYLVRSPTQTKKAPKELWALRPDRVQVIPGPRGMPQAYRYSTGNSFIDFPVDPVTGQSDVLHVKEFHPLDDWLGLSRVEPSAYGVDRHNAASAHNKALLDNGARPSGALVYKPIKDSSGNEISPPSEVIAAARDELREKFGGPSKAGQPFVFNGNVEWTEMGISPKDMDFAAGKDDAARDICSAFGVPFILVVPGQSTYNNVREAKLELWEDTILPLLDRSVDALNAWLTPQFDPNLTLSIGIDEISALEPRREAKRNSIGMLLDKGVIDSEEARDALQYGPRPEGALRLQRGDGPIIQALISGAQTNPGILEPLYHYLQSVGLVDRTTTLEQFVTSYNEGPGPGELQTDLGLAPNAQSDLPDETLTEQ
jgi:HK97 family phage portal protein